MNASNPKTLAVPLQNHRTLGIAKDPRLFEAKLELIGDRLSVLAKPFSNGSKVALHNRRNARSAHVLGPKLLVKEVELRLAQPLGNPQMIGNRACWTGQESLTKGQDHSLRIGAFWNRRSNLRVDGKRRIYRDNIFGLGILCRSWLA